MSDTPRTSFNEAADGLAASLIKAFLTAEVLADIGTDDDPEVELFDMQVAEVLRAYRRLCRSRRAGERR